MCLVKFAPAGKLQTLADTGGCVIDDGNDNQEKRLKINDRIEKLKGLLKRQTCERLKSLEAAILHSVHGQQLVPRCAFYSAEGAIY